MKVEITGQVGPSLLSDGVGTQPFRQGRLGEAIVQQLHGRYYELAKRGSLFIVSTPAAGVTVPIYTNAAQQFVIYNPVSSGIDIVLKRVWVGYVSGTMVAGHMCYAGSVGQGAPGTITQANVQNARLVTNLSTASGAGNKGNYYSPGSPATALVAANYLRPMGNSQVAQAAVGTNSPWVQMDDVEGGIIVPPQGILVVASNVAAASVSAIAALVEEVPV